MKPFPMERRELIAEIAKLRAALNAVCTPIFRNDIIEECARLVADHEGTYGWVAEKLAAAIRALKDKP